MAEAAIDLQASNIFGLDPAFNTQSSTQTTATQNVATNDESGNVACQQNINSQIDATQSATYCGNDFVGDAGDLLTEFGNFRASGGVVTSVSINMSAGEYATIDITGHNHTVNKHEAGLQNGYADVSDFLPHEVGEAFAAWDGFGVPDFGLTIGDDASPSSASVTFSMNHIDTNDEAGDHLVGKNITPRCELSMDFEGSIGNDASVIETMLESNTNLMLNPIVDSVAESDSNSAFDTSSFSAHANPELETV